MCALLYQTFYLLLPSFKHATVIHSCVHVLSVATPNHPRWHPRAASPCDGWNPMAHQPIDGCLLGMVVCWCLLGVLHYSHIQSLQSLESIFGYGQHVRFHSLWLTCLYGLEISFRSLFYSVVLWAEKNTIWWEACARCFKQSLTSRARPSATQPFTSHNELSWDINPCISCWSIVIYQPQNSWNKIEMRPLGSIWQWFPLC